MRFRLHANETAVTGGPTAGPCTFCAQHPVSELEHRAGQFVVYLLLSMTPRHVVHRRLLLLLLFLAALVLAWLRRRQQKRLLQAPGPRVLQRQMIMRPREYAAFLSHYKVESASEARWLQRELEERLQERVFLDSDDLLDLTKLTEFRS